MILKPAGPLVGLTISLHGLLIIPRILKLFGQRLAATRRHGASNQKLSIFSISPSLSCDHQLYKEHETPGAWLVVFGRIVTTLNFTKSTSRNMSDTHYSLVNNKFIHRRWKLFIKLSYWMRPGRDSQMKQKWLREDRWGWSFLATSAALCFPFRLFGWTYKTQKIK